MDGKRDETNFYSRMDSIGDYSNNNRLDTLFIFQLTFIYILSLITILYLSKVGLLAELNKWIIIICLTLGIIFVYVNRIIIMNKIRDTTTWDRVNFGDGSIVPDNFKKSDGTSGGIAGTANRYNCSEPICTPI